MRQGIYLFEVLEQHRDLQAHCDADRLVHVQQPVTGRHLVQVHA
jgi:hypothetical protein